jgi:hypothetical protein
MIANLLAFLLLVSSGHDCQQNTRVILYEDMSYRTESDAYTVTCDVRMPADTDSPKARVQFVSIAYNDSDQVITFTKWDYTNHMPFPESVITLEHTYTRFNVR